MSDKFIALKGGLDLVTPPISASPGAVSDALNFFESVKGGYTRLAGYERIDGQPMPSKATYYLIGITDWDLRATGTPLVIGGSITVDTAVFTVLRLVPSVDGTQMEVVAVDPVGVIPDDLEDVPYPFDTYCLINSAVERGADTEELDSVYLKEAQDARRVLIQPVPGSGGVEGVAGIAGELLAWRDDGTGVSKAYKISAAGWVPVEYAQIVTTTVVTVPIRGDACNSGTQTVLGVFTYYDAAGVPDATKQALAVHNTTGTPLAVTDVLTRDSDAANCGVVEELIPYEYTAGGKVRSIIHNFYASAATRHLYFADGVNMAGVYKPAYNCIQPIASNYRVMDDTFVSLHAHNGRLWLATDYGTSITSVANEPEDLDGFLGGSEWGASDALSGYASSGAEMLHVFTANTVRAVKGTSLADWSEYLVTDSVGAFRDSIVRLDDIFSVSTRGISSLSRTQSIGGFDAATISDDIQPLMRTLNTSELTGSVALKGLNQMRFFFGDRFLMVSRVPFNANGNEGIRYGMTEGQYNHVVSCINSDEDEAGQERIVFGSTDGYVYQTDVGTSFDGEHIVSTLSLHYNHLGSPEMRKRWRGVDLEVSASSLVNLRLYYALNDGRKTFSSKEVVVDGGGSGWDEGQYDLAIYDAYPLSRKKVKLSGTGHNIEFTFYHSGAMTKPFTLTGYTLRYSNRGLTT